MRAATAGLPRFVAGLSTGKRAVLEWADRQWSTNNSIVVFAFDDHFSMAVLQSRAHVAWAWARSSTLETRLRYTPTSVFETFPWPDQATQQQRDRAAEACRRLLARRAELCQQSGIGLTKLYNAMDEGAYADLKALHRDLDEAVADCYGWPRSVAQDARALVAHLTELNRAIATGAREYQPFTYLA